MNRTILALIALLPILVAPAFADVPAIVDDPRFPSPVRLTGPRPNDGEAVVFTPPGGSATEVGRIVAIPLAEEFWDGSHWAAPAAPVIGQPLPAR